MAKAAIVEDDIYARTADEILAAEVNADDSDEPRKVGMAPELALPFQGNVEQEYQTINAQRAFEEAPEKPLQPYVLESSAFKSDMLKREAVLNSDIAVLEGQRDGMNARIDDMHRTRVAVRAAIEVLK